MPYIRQDDRKNLDPLITSLSLWLDTDGQLNYAISRLILLQWKRSQGYGTLARLTGVLQNVSQEFYRRVGADYEDTKRAENGDLPEFRK